MGARPSLSDGLLESLEDTLTESMLSPELPVGGERGISLTGELAALLSAPRNSLGRRGSQQLDNEINSSQQSGLDTNVMPKKITFNTFFYLKPKLSSVRFRHCHILWVYLQAESLHHAFPGLWRGWTAVTETFNLTG